jgi:hypothetical protein
MTWDWIPLDEARVMTGVWALEESRARRLTPVPPTPEPKPIEISDPPIEITQDLYRHYGPLEISEPELRTAGLRGVRYASWALNSYSDALLSGFPYVATGSLFQNYLHSKVPRGSDEFIWTASVKVIYNQHLTTVHEQMYWLDGQLWSAGGKPMKQYTRVCTKCGNHTAFIPSSTCFSCRVELP